MRNGDILPVEFMARREDWSEGISLYMRQRIVGVREDIAAPVQMLKYEKGTLAAPMCRIGIQSAQGLMDELWNCGLRPTEGTGSAGSLAATERHLSDMQKIVFSFLDKEIK